MDIEPEEQNDAITKVDCKLAMKCCDTPDLRKQFGGRQGGCVCFSCKKRCFNCEGDYIGNPKR